MILKLLTIFDLMKLQLLDTKGKKADTSLEFLLF